MMDSFYLLQYSVYFDHLSTYNVCTLLELLIGYILYISRNPDKISSKCLLPWIKKTMTSEIRAEFLIQYTEGNLLSIDWQSVLNRCNDNEINIILRYQHFYSMCYIFPQYKELSVSIYTYASASATVTCRSFSKSTLFPAMQRQISFPNIFLSSFTQFLTWKDNKQRTINPFSALIL
jgi:hypothetical protein